MGQVETERAILDAQYNLRAAVPEHLTYFARYEAESAALRARWSGRLDLSYGPTPRQAIDLFLPDTSGAPLLVFIHGGYWQSRDRKDFSFVAGPLVERGAAVALIGYDIAPTVRMDAIVAQIRTGLAWLYRHAPDHGCDARDFTWPAIPRAGIWPPWRSPPSGPHSACPRTSSRASARSAACSISSRFACATSTRWSAWTRTRRAATARSISHRTGAAR